MKHTSWKDITRKIILPNLVVVLLITNYLTASSWLSTYQASGLDSNATQANTIFLPMILKLCPSCYFVDSMNGSDSNSGKSPQDPWQTLDAVNRTPFIPGSKIYFKRGSSWTGKLAIKYSGTQAQPIVYTTYGDGPKPIFRNPGDAQNQTIVINIHANWVIVEGFLIEDAQNAGILIMADNTIVRENEITNVGIGVDIEGQFNLITRNNIHQLHMVVNTPGGNYDDYGANGILMNDGSSNEISYNTVSDCTSPSYDFGTGGHALEMWRVANNNYIHHNLTYNNNMFLEVGGGEAKGNTIAYNISIDNGTFSYIHLSCCNGSITENFRVENNTIVNSKRIAPTLEVIGFDGSPNTGTFLLRNNIFYIAGLYRIFGSYVFSHDHNIYFIGGNTKLGFSLNPTEKIADPLFTDLESNDYHLKMGSPAIDAGANLNYPFDFDNVPVPIGPAPDIGAYEFH